MLIAISYWANACRYGRHLEFCLVENRTNGSLRLWLQPYVCACEINEYIPYALRGTCTHKYRVHTLSLPFSIDIANSSIATFCAAESCMHANEQMDTNEHFILISHVSSHATNLPSIWHEVRAICCSDKWQGKFIWPTCALRKYQRGWGGVLDECCSNEMNWNGGAVAGVIARKVLKQERFHSFQQWGTKPWRVYWIKLFKMKQENLSKYIHFESMLFQMKQQNVESNFFSV